MKLKERYSKVKSSVSRKFPLFLLIFLFYFIVNILVNNLYITFPTLLHINVIFLVPYLLFNLIISLLVSVNGVLVIEKIKELNQIKKSGGMVGLGIFGGLLGSACPGCFAGLFPAFVGLFGITASLGNLPLNGLELQVFSSFILVVSLVLLTNENKCEVKI